MSASRTHRKHTARRLAGIGALAVAALAAAAVPALAGGSAKPAKRHAGKTVVFKFYALADSFIYTTAAGKVLAQPPKTPATGDRLDFTDLDYVGDHTRHAKRWAVSDHTQCIFGANPGNAPTCYGQAAMGGGQLLLFTTPGGPGRGGKTVVSGGTGRYAGATGTVDMTEIAGTNNTDVVVTVHLAK